LQELNEIGKKIITVEDPVEYRLSRVNQVQINPKIGLTFARVLRASLRQDPDILLVGEIRDQETAEIALRAAMTGHMVLSTLHTNDAVSSAMRLVDMGAEGFLAATAIRAVLAQRLVRRLCDNCCIEHVPDQREVQWIRHVLGDLAPQEFELKQASGCHRCNNTGYRGRVGVFELLVLNDDMADSLRRGNSSDFVRAARLSNGYRPLVVSALLDAFKGVTSLEEVYKVAEQLDESGDWMMQSAPLQTPGEVDSEAGELAKSEATEQAEASHIMAWEETD
jgi:MSHA biogenesis protein MshE